MLSDPVSPIFAIVAILIALSYASFLERLFPLHASTTRISTLDGLRGFLVISVFVHHSCIWFFYIKTGKWQLPPSYFYGNLGQVSVALFFMITGFLFYSKLLRARAKEIDWIYLYISRFMRLCPLYLLMLLAICCIVMYQAEFELRDAPLTIIKSMVKWTAFGIFGMPDINEHRSTATIVASVVWSLPYEWLFYAALPVLGIFLGPKRRVLPLFLSICGCAFIAHEMNYPSLVQLSIFLGGIAAAYCDRFVLMRALCTNRFAGCIAILCLGVVLFMAPSAYAWKPILLLSIAFIIIACGNSLFGLLTGRGVRLIGDMGYSVYLLHGIFLYLIFGDYIGAGSAQQSDVLMFWAVVCALVVPLITVCYATFRFIEAPAMGASTRIHSEVLRIFRKRVAATSVAQG
jgi:peptidoglycan/LPS O-acetylase OafA/YrhL